MPIWKVCNVEFPNHYDLVNSYWEAICLKGDIESTQTIKCMIIDCDLEESAFYNKKIKEMGGLFDFNTSWKDSGVEIGESRFFVRSENDLSIWGHDENRYAQIHFQFDSSCNIRRVRDKLLSFTIGSPIKSIDASYRELESMYNYLVREGYVVKPPKDDLTDQDIVVWNQNIGRWAC